MPTRNFVPRNDNEGHLGKPSKKWLKVWAYNIWTNLITDGSISFTPAAVDNVLKKDLVEYVSVPLSQDSPGTKGQVALTDNFLYVCIASNTWKRVVLNNWE